ncbi:MAG: HD domain-containing protein [Spirochaetales bacterium]|nr:HD domain-containing protein [Spirochaetales bacterium]
MKAKGEKVSDKSKIILEKLARLHQIKDLHSLLDNILYESRVLTNADAGSIFLVENNRLKFSYIQNDTIFKNDILCNKYIYANHEIEVDEKSIAGYVAKTGEPLIIDDVYHIDKRAPYSFNAYFDEISTYRTKSMLVVPLKTMKGEVLGAMELINSLNKAGKPIPFSLDYQLVVVQFANYATLAIERAFILRDMVFKMIKLSEMRDPEETQEHVERVSTYAIEIYQKWAEMHNVDKAEVAYYKDILRIATMLHDIGKIGIPDTILKKKAGLNEREYETIKFHTIYGAQLFQNAKSDWESMASEIVMNHHEKWDGTGYPGKIPDINAEDISIEEGKKGAEIPLSARIVALADVYDALINQRVYKSPWEEDKVLYFMKEQSGKHFDPELVAVFFEIYGTINAIRNRWHKPVPNPDRE